MGYVINLLKTDIQLKYGAFSPREREREEEEFLCVKKATQIFK